MFVNFRKASATHRDKRLNIVTEIIKAMKAVKLYCWEAPFGELLKKERRCCVTIFVISD